ncbi:MAG: Crp/Fnr family transcriptional regulator [Sandaracinaceae bacterium]|nr:Crp/Fnr family transcriptional regulator [Sandaracinaceae bacterium]
MPDKEHLEEGRRASGKLVALRTSKLFHGLTPELFAPLVELSRFRSFDEASSIWTAGQPAEAMIVVNQGFVAAMTRHASGRASISNIFGPSESAGDGLVFSSGASYPIEVRTLTAVQVLWLPFAPLRELCAQYPELRSCVDLSIRAHLFALRDRIGTLSAGSVGIRLATFFIFVNARFGTDSNDGRAVRMPLSRAVLADLVAARVETIVRVLSDWKQRKWMVDLDDGFWFARGALENLVAEQTDE